MNRTPLPALGSCVIFGEERESNIYGSATADFSSGDLSIAAAVDNEADQKS
jgi:hypothetical protein